MRAFNRYSKRGFTLVELMIVVAIIGVLAALAIYGVRKYLASAKTAEAKNSIGAIARGAAGSYERETTTAENLGEGSSSVGTRHSLCATSTAVPAAIASVAGTKYSPNTTEGQDFQSGSATAGWKCLKFEINQPIQYQYQYTAMGGSTALGSGSLTGDASLTSMIANGFEAAAIGNLDGDTVYSGFARYGEINDSTQSLTLSTQVYVENEFE